MNRATYYGDGIFETLRIANGNACFVATHYERMLHSALMLGIEHKLLSSKMEFSTYITNYIHTHSLTHARLRLQLSRIGTMGYSCNSNIGKLHIMHDALVTPYYVLNTAAYSYGTYTQNYKPCTPLSNIKTTSAVMYVLAGNYAVANNYNEVILLNEHGRVAEGYKSNLFIVKNNVIITPTLSEGALNGVLRSVIITMCNTLNIPCNQATLTPQEITNADEVWFTNVIQGICCATPTNTIAQKMIETLNNSIKHAEIH